MYRKEIVVFPKTNRTQLPIILEMLGLTKTREEYVASWSEFTDETLTKTEWSQDDEDGSWISSKPIIVCNTILGIIEAPFESETTAVEKESLEILNFILESTAKIVNRANPNPNGEMDIQRIMHAHLESTFDSFTSSLTIPKPIVSFKPDCGIINLKAAIEFKFADSLKDYKVAVHGLTEDLSGYAGSLDWTKFISVVYQTGPYGTKSQLVTSLKKSGNAEFWTIHLVDGPGTRKKRTKKK